MCPVASTTAEVPNNLFDHENTSQHQRVVHFSQSVENHEPSANARVWVQLWIKQKNRRPSDLDVFKLACVAEEPLEDIEKAFADILSSNLSQHSITDITIASSVTAEGSKTVTVNHMFTVDLDALREAAVWLGEQPVKCSTTNGP